MLLLLSHFSHVQLCATPSLGFSRQEHWSGLPFPSPMHKSERWKWSCSVMSNSLRPHGLQPTRLLRPWDFPGKSTGVGCHCLLCNACYNLINFESAKWKKPTTKTIYCMVPFMWNVRISESTTDLFKTGKGVQQVCIPSLWLFNLFNRIHLVKCQAGWITSWNQDFWEKCQHSEICRWYHSNDRKWITREPLDEAERGEWKSWLEIQYSKH